MNGKYKPVRFPVQAFLWIEGARADRRDGARAERR